MRFFDEIWECLNCYDLEQKFAKFNQIWDNFYDCKMDYDSQILPLSTPSYAKFCDVKSLKELKQKH
ncbi:MAG: DUF455 domain-containing protein, partial [Campylobacter sp.]|nr:DUF455 domain-containing protein [Campylobacter sp.]